MHIVLKYGARFLKNCLLIHEKYLEILGSEYFNRNIVHANLHLQEVDLLEGDEEVPPSPKALVQASLPKERAPKEFKGST